MEEKRTGLCFICLEPIMFVPSPGWVHEDGGAEMWACPSCSWRGAPFRRPPACPRCGEKSLVLDHRAEPATERRKVLYP